MEDLKILVIGPKNSGKSTVGMIIQNELKSYEVQYQPSSDSEYLSHIVELDKEQVMVHMYIMPGDIYRFDKTSHFYYKQYDAVFCMMDVSDKDCYEKIQPYIAKAKDICGDDTIYLIGNKIDMISNGTNKDPENFHSKQTEAFHFSNKETARFVPSSANKNLNIRETIISAIATVRELRTTKKNDPNYKMRRTVPVFFKDHPKMEPPSDSLSVINIIFDKILSQIDTEGYTVGFAGSRHHIRVPEAGVDCIVPKSIKDIFTICSKAIYDKNEANAKNAFKKIYDIVAHKELHKTWHDTIWQKIWEFIRWITGREQTKDQKEAYTDIYNAMVESSKVLIPSSTPMR